MCARKFIIKNQNTKQRDINIYANKSALILEWLLFVGIKRKKFAIREVARELPVSIGLIQKVFMNLIHKGFMSMEGVRTSKQFSLKKPHTILKNWLDYYSLTKKCRIRSYSSTLNNFNNMVSVIKENNLAEKVAFALHSSTRVNNFSNTNLTTLELYILEDELLSTIEEVLELEPQERGYDVILISPYYKSMLSKKRNNNVLNWPKFTKNSILSSPPLLSFLDLYDYPLRGREQAEFLLKKLDGLKNIYKKTNGSKNLL